MVDVVAQVAEPDAADLDRHLAGLDALDNLSKTELGLGDLAFLVAKANEPDLIRGSRFFAHSEIEARRLGR